MKAYPTIPLQGDLIWSDGTFKDLKFGQRKVSKLKEDLFLTLFQNSPIQEPCNSNKEVYKMANEKKGVSEPSLSAK
jgi:hypothetical protein